MPAHALKLRLLAHALKGAANPGWWGVLPEHDAAQVELIRAGRIEELKQRFGIAPRPTSERQAR